MYRGPQDSLLVATGAAEAHAAGVTGKGVKVGILDSQVELGYGPIANRVQYSADFTGAALDGTSQGKSGHGSIMAALTGGAVTAEYQGGIAPESLLYMARVCSNDACKSSHIGAAAKNLTEHGVRLLNLSLGQTATTAAANAYQDLGKAVLSADALLVAAAGNHSSAQPPDPDIPAVLPSYASSPGYASPMTLGNNWIAVVNLRLDANGRPYDLDPSSNKCGVASNYCLAAPGQHAIAPLANTSFANAQYVNGTSSSAAVITGVAALVWQKYPWMSASNVQQTVLTTATDFGDPGVDPLFGWGVVNAAKAIKGPAQFPTTFSANVPQDNGSSFQNDISGPGGLEKHGKGTLELAGNNSFTGTTRVHDGRLLLTGNVVSDVDVFGSSTLQANGGRIGGTFRAQSGVTTAISPDAPLRINGDAHLAGTLHLLPFANSQLIDTTALLLSARELHGRFDHVTYANDIFWSAQLQYSNDRLSAHLARTSASASTAAMSSSVAVQNGAAAADALVNAQTASPSSAFFPTNRSDAIASVSSGLLLADQNTVEASLVSMGAPLLALNLHARTQDAIDSLASAAHTLAGDDQQDTRLWAQHNGQAGQLSIDTNTDARWHKDGISAGMMFNGVTSGHLWGVTMTQSSMITSHLRDRSWSQQSSFHAWQKRQFNDFSTLMLLETGSGDTEFVRDQIIGNDMRRLYSRRRDWLTQLRAEASWKSRTGFAPYFATTLLHQHFGRQIEQDQSGLGLQVEPHQTASLFLEPGIRIATGIAQWRLGANLSWSYLTAGQNLDRRAHYLAVPGNSFNLPGPEFGDHRLQMNLRAERHINPRTVFNAQLMVNKEEGQSVDASAVVLFRREF